MSAVAGLFVARFASGAVGGGVVKKMDSELSRRGTGHEHEPTGSPPSEEEPKRRRQLDPGEALAAFSRRANSALGANLSAKSRKPWECMECHRAQLSGSTYWYRKSGYGPDTMRIKYCGSCRTAAFDKEKSNRIDMAIRDHL
jgi:hypothetical protein